MKLNVLITGINGFVGSALAERELIKGNHVIGIIREKNNKSRLDILTRCSIVIGDITNQKLVDRVVSEYEVDLVYHVAAQSIVRIANTNPVNCYYSNVMGTAVVLDSVRRIRPLAKVVMASSDKAYGEHDTLPYTEDMPLYPTDPYGTSKSCSDLVAQSFSRTYGTNISIIRCANIYGAGDMNTSRIIPNTILSILRGQAPKIYGGSAIHKREYIYINDVVNAYEIVATHGESGEVYNIGDEESRTTEEVVRLICDRMKYNGLIDIVDKSFSEIKYQYLCANKLKGLGWSKTVSFSEGIDKAINFYTNA